MIRLSAILTVIFVACMQATAFSGNYYGSVSGDGINGDNYGVYNNNNKYNSNYGMIIGGSQNNVNQNVNQNNSVYNTGDGNVMTIGDRNGVNVNSNNQNNCDNSCNVYRDALSLAKKGEYVGSIMLCDEILSHGGRAYAQAKKLKSLILNH